MGRHRAERVAAKSQAVDLVTKLPAADFAALFAKPVPATKKASVNKEDTDDVKPPVASGSGDAKGKGKAVKEDKKLKVVKPEVDPAELVVRDLLRQRCSERETDAFELLAQAQAKLKAEKDAEKAARKLAKDQAVCTRTRADAARLQLTPRD